MDKWEIPSCCICYDRLLTKLSLLPDCGHIYHEQCLKSWFDKIGLSNLRCPLCRTNVVKNIYPLNYTITKIEESIPKADKGVDNDNSKSDVIDPEQIKSYLDEIDDLKSRLSASTDDRLDYYNKIHEIEEQYNELKDKFDHELNSNKAIMKQNRDLMLSTENQKATNSALIKRLDSLKNDLEKFKNISKYLEDPNTSEIQDIATMVENMTSDEKIKFLMNRLVDLNGIVNELKDANESVINERDRIDKLYKNLKIAIKENFQLKKQNLSHVSDIWELPGIYHEDMADFVYDKRMMMERVLSKPTDELQSVKSTPNGSKTPVIKDTLSTPEKSKTVNSNPASETSTGNDPMNPGLNNIIRKMKTIKNGATPPPRYKPQNSLKPIRTPEQAVLKGLCNSNTPDGLSTKSETYRTTPIRYNKTRMVRRVKHNGDAPRNEKTSKIHNFFKQTKEDVW